MIGVLLAAAIASSFSSSADDIQAAIASSSSSSAEDIQSYERRITAYDRAFKRAEGRPERCGRFLANEWEKAKPGTILKYELGSPGCENITLPSVYAVESTNTGVIISRQGRVIVELVYPPPPPPITGTLTMIDRRPGHERDRPIVYEIQTTERREGGALLIDIPQMQNRREQ